MALLDNLTGVCVLCLSTQKEKDSYTSDPIKVRRSSDNAEQDLSWDTNDIISDSSTIENGTTAFSTWYGSDSVYVTILRDQTGNGNTASKSTASQQPQIVSSGTLLVDDEGYATLRFDGSDDYFNIADTSGLDITTGDVSLYLKCSTTDTSSHVLCRNSNSVNTVQYSLSKFTNWEFFLNGAKITEGAVDSGYNKVVATYDHVDAKIYDDTTLDGTASYTTDLTTRPNVVLGCRSNATDGSTGAFFLSGDISKAMIFSTALGTDDIAEIQTPTTGIDLDMDTININRALPDPTLLLSIELNMDTININRALPDPTATVVPNSVELDMTTINIDRALPDPDVSLSLELDMDTININRALPDPSVSIGINLDMSTLNINRAIPDPTILLSIEINPNEININRALPDPDVTILGGAIDLSMTTININRALPDVDLDIPIVLDMDVININRALPEPAVSLNIRCDMDTLNIDRALPDTTVLLSIELDMDTINISRSVLNPSVTIGAEVPTGVVNTYKFEFFALNYININIPSKEQYPRVIEFKKNTSEILPITADFFGLLAGIEEIAAIDTKAYLVDSDVTAQIIDSSSFGTYDVDLVVKSGSNGNTYKLTIKITTDDSNIYEEDILMYVRDRVDHEEFTKQPSEQFGVALNLINKLQASETIDTVEFSVLDSSLQTVTLDLIEKYEIDDNLVKFLLKEGIDNETYNININMTTNLGHIYNKNLTLKVVDT